MESGTRIGGYRVTAALGAGGMGEVWRAEDTTLGRQVALKLLPSDFADDPERHTRFEREAKVLAALNHPNIATLYGLEHLDGQHVLVMELVEGEGLDEIIARGPIPADEAIPIALQIAEALEAAHEAGIVHRDLKPANIRIRPDGTVKVLDFGLAKTWESETADEQLSYSPTITRHHTRAGVILGTAAYMSPEQARGKQVDRRADIWAFGVVLWEMLAGMRLFTGEEVTDVLAAVLRDEPDLGVLPDGSPGQLRRLIERCLRRDPRSRLQWIGDARILLEEARAGDSRATDGPQPPLPTRRSRSTALSIAATAAVVVAAALVGLALMGREAIREPRRLSILLPSEQRLITDGNSLLAFDPDGRSLLMTGESGGRQMILRRSLDGAEVEAIAGTEAGQAAFFSPDGRWIGFISNNRLMKVAVEGGTPFSLADCQGAGGAAWLPDGTLVFAPTYSDGLFRISAEGGVPERLTTPDRTTGVLGHWWPEPLPGARRVLFTAFRTPVDRSRIGVLDLDTRELRWVVEGGFFGRYAASGHLLYARGQRLYAVPFDPETATVQGSAVAVVDDLRVAQTGGFAMFAVSSLGDLAYVTESFGNPKRELVWLDRSGRAQPATTQRQRYLSVSLSPDNRTAAVTIQGESRDLWTYSFDRGTLSRLTSSPGTEFDPQWSEDGRELFYIVDEPPFVPYRIPTGSPDAGRPIWDEPATVDTSATAVAPDGLWLALVRSELESRDDVHVRPIDGSEASRPFRATRADESFPSFSPDGRWLTYQSDETGRPEIYVEAFPGPGERFQLSADGGVQPLWVRGSGEILFRHDDEFRAVDTSLDDGRIEFGTPRNLFSYAIERSDAVEARTYAVTADGQRILAVTVPDADQPRRLEIVTDLVQSLPRLVPSGG